jgi:hypothetical protein
MRLLHTDGAGHYDTVPSVPSVPRDEDDGGTQGTRGTADEHDRARDRALEGLDQ